MPPPPRRLGKEDHHVPDRAVKREGDTVKLRGNPENSSRPTRRHRGQPAKTFYVSDDHPDGNLFKTFGAIAAPSLKVSARHCHPRLARSLNSLDLNAIERLCAQLHQAATLASIWRGSRACVSALQCVACCGSDDSRIAASKHWRTEVRRGRVIEQHFLHLRVLFEVPRLLESTKSSLLELPTVMYAVLN